MKKFKKLTALLIAAVMTMSACSGSSAPSSSAPSSSSASSGGAASESKAPTQNTLTVALATEVSKLDPHAPQIITTNQVLITMYDLLITMDREGNFHPSVATSWEQIDDTTIKFILRDDVYFHNGEKLTAYDVAWSISRAATEPGSASLMASFDPETYAEDETTLIVKLVEPFAAALAYLAGARGLIMCQKAVEELGGDEHGYNPVGSGPFKFVKWIPGDRLEFVRNEDYWGEKPQFENLIFRIIPDSSIRAIELESGGVDFTFSVGPEDFERLTDNPDIVTYSAPGFTHEVLQFNMRTELPPKDVRVRKAMMYALDIPAIVRTVWGEFGAPADSIFATDIFGHISIGPVERDVELAKQLLTEAGYPDGFDIEITVPESRETLNMLEVAQAMWAEVGINLTITPYDQATIKERNAAGITQFGRSNFTASSGDADHAMSNWAIGYKGVFNANDEYIDEKMREARAEYDVEKRAQLYAELQEYCWETYWSIPLVFPNVSYAHRSNVAGFVFAPSQMPELYQLYFTN